MSDERELEALWALVTPHRERLMDIARRRCATDPDAEDCVHEAMLRAVAYRRLDPGRISPLLSALVVRTAVDQARRRSVERRGRPRLAMLPGQQPAPDEALADGDEARWLAEQVGRLPVRERQVFEHRAAGFTAAETARVLQLSYKAVESAFTRARHRLRLWAATGAILIGDLVRRRRQRPAMVATLLAGLTAGCLIASTPGGRAAPELGARGGVALPDLHGAEPPSTGAQALAGARRGDSPSGRRPAAAAGRRASGRPGSTTGPGNAPILYAQTPPVNNPTNPNGPPLVSYVFVWVDQFHDPVHHFEYCVGHPWLGPDKWGCPPT